MMLFFILLPEGQGGTWAASWFALARIALQYQTGLGCNGFLRETETKGMGLAIASWNHLRHSCLAKLCWSSVLSTLGRGQSGRAKFVGREETWTLICSCSCKEDSPHYVQVGRRGLTWCNSICTSAQKEITCWTGSHDKWNGSPWSHVVLLSPVVMRVK